MNIDIIFKIAAIGILIAVICQILKKNDRDDIATMVSLVGLIIVLTFVINMIGELFQNIKDIFNLYWYGKNSVNNNINIGHFVFFKKR